MEECCCDDTYDKIIFDISILSNKVDDVKKRIRETPWYHIRVQWRLYNELRNLSKQSDKIGERLERIEKNPIQVIKRT
jgi:hypothetical protein